MKKQRSTEFIALASIAFLIITLGVITNFLRTGKATTPTSSKAAGYDRSVYGEGRTEIVEFKINLMHLARSDKDKGVFWVKTLLPDAEVEIANFKVEGISWAENIPIAFVTGTVNLTYKDGSEEVKHMKTLLVDQDERLGDGYPDVLGIRFCYDSGCSSSYTPWSPWSVVEGNIVVE
ncbi:hypothetical protein JXA63_03290 [Candidatus Woesebacteria bacterium]|nr:hypothetical protein [Candidatus Woesebacteria bacterium]